MKSVLILLALLSTSAAGNDQHGNRPELVLQTGHSRVGHFDLSPARPWLASSGVGTVNFWDLDTGRVIRAYSAHEGRVRGVEFSPSGKLLATCGEDGTARIWDVATGQLLQTLTGHESQVNAIAFSPGEDIIATGAGDAFQQLRGGGTSDNSVRLWDVASGREIAVLNGHTSQVNSIAFDPRGRWLATGGYDKTVRIWVVATRRQLHVLTTHGKQVTSVDVSPDGRLLASASYDRTIKLWDPRSGDEIRTLTHPLDIVSVKFGPDGKVLASSAYNEDIRLWEVASGRELQTFAGRPGDLAFNADGSVLATKDRRSRSIKLWDTRTGDEITELRGRVAPPSAVRISPGGEWLASTSGPKVNLWRVDDGRLVRSAAVVRRWVGGLVFSADGSRLAAHGDSAASVTDVGTGRILRTVEEDYSIQSVALDARGQRLATGIEAEGPRGRPASDSLDNTVTIWDVASGDELFRLEGHTDPVHALAFSPAGPILASAGGSYAVSGKGDNSVRLWNADNGRLLRRLDGHDAKVNAVAFSSEGSLLASGSGHMSRIDNSIRLWDVATGQELARFSGHRSEVRAVEFAPDSRWLASGSADHTVRIWDLITRSEAAILQGHTGAVTALDFTPDGEFLVSGSSDGSIRLWEVDSGEQRALIASMRDSDDWVIVNPDGLFDGSAQGTQDLVAWRLGSRTYPPDRFFADYYTPGLLATLLRGENPVPTIDISSIKMPPAVRILSPEPGDSRQGEIGVVVEATDLGGGVAEVRLYQNGKLVGKRPGGGAGKASHEFRVSLVPARNTFTAKALNSDRVEGDEDSVTVTLPARGVGLANDGAEEGDGTPKPDLHILAVGINKYEDPTFDLGFAQPDADAVARFFENGSPLFASVGVTRLFNEDATKVRIERALDRLVEQAQPRDVLLIYLAGHGVGLDQQFYFLAHGMRTEADEEAAIRKYGVSASVLGDAMLRAAALKQVLILDACQSESALSILAKAAMFRGMGVAEKKAVRMLARSNGIFLIAASTSQQYAFEVEELGHGVLTYALLSGLGEGGTPRAPTTQDGIVTMHSLLQYVSQEVPELTDAHHKGRKQYPVTSSTGMDFPLSIKAAPGSH